MIRKVLLCVALLTLAVSSLAIAASISRDWQETLRTSGTVVIDRIQVYLAEAYDSSGNPTIREFDLSPYALRLANNTKVWNSGTTTQTDWYDAGSGYNPVATYWGVPNSQGLTQQTVTVHPVTGLYVTYVEPMQNWVNAAKDIAVIEAPSYILGSFLGIREYWETTVPAAGKVYYQFYKDGVLVDSCEYTRAVGAGSWTMTDTNTSSNWASGFISIGSTYTITASAGSGGSISPTGSVSVNAGASQTFTITPNSGYSIANVTVDGVSQGAITSYTFSNVTANHTISATFSSAATYTITAIAGAGGTISPSGSVAVNSGDDQTFIITPNAGYCILDVTVDGVSQGAFGSLTLANVSANHTVTATFANDMTAYYKFDETSGTSASDSSGNNRNATLNGSCTWGAGKYGNAVNIPGGTSYVSLPSGTVSGLTNFSVVTWVKLSSVSTNMRIFDFGTSTSNYMMLTPKHANSGGKIRYSIVSGGTTQSLTGTSALPTGSWQHVVVTRSGNTGTLYVNGSQVAQITTMTLSPSSLGTTTNDWIGDSQTSSHPHLNGQVDGFRIYNRALSSSEVNSLYNTESNAYTITTSAGSNGSISPSGAVAVSSGASQTFTITPNSGYAVANVTVDGVSQGAISSYTFNNVTANHTISATFNATPTSYTITASAGSHGAISPSGAVTVNSGASQTFTITPDSGYVVDSVLVDGTSQGAITSYTFGNVTANHTISATFVTQPPAPTGLVLELRPQDYTGTQWPIYQGSLKDANPSLAYFAPSGTPQLVPNVAGTRHSGLAMNNTVWDQCLGLGGPIAPSSITGTNPRTIEVWSYNPALGGEETLVDLSHRGGITGQHFALENGGNWALNGSGTGDVTDWNSSNRTNRWVHLVVTYSAGVARFYVDGVLTVTKNCTYDIFAGDSIAIGSQRTSATTASNSASNLNSQVYIGYIGNVRVYDTALTASEVTGRFGLGVNGGEALATTYTVSGRVTDGTNGISGALVYFSTSAGASLSPVYTATTDSTGNYTQTLPAGTWYIAASKGRYTPHPTADTQVVLTSNQIGKNFTLTYVTTPAKLLDMDASQIAGSDNDQISSWANAGTLAGTFSLDGTDQTTRPVLSTVLNKRCLTFDGTNDRLKLFDGANAINAPAGLTGNSDWTVCGWYHNPSLASTECYLGWANSGEQLGARCGFMYGSHNGDGAVMHGASPWLNANMAMIPLPTTGLWHHIAVTFDGTVEKVYVDGAINQTETKNLRLGSGQPFFMGTWYGTASGGTPNNYYSGSIASLTVYDQVLTDSEIYSLGYQPVYTISGSVKNNSNEPIAGALVYFNTTTNASVSPLLTASTDANGNYSQQVPPGTWYISAMKSRHTPNPATDLSATVTNANVTGKNFTLTPSATLHKLIDLNAASLTAGALSSWTNTGTLGGNFAQDGTDSTTNPTIASVAGKNAVTFDGSNDRLKASFTAPAGITSGSDWTVSAIVYNPSISSEEAYLCWAQRGTASRAAEFGYGSSYSAYHVTNNMAWSTVPTAGAWHHVAVTYDGSVEKTYVDGVLSVQSTSRYLNLWAGQPAFIGVAFDNATGTTKSQWFSGSMAALQVYDEALTEAEVRSIATVTISGQVTGPTGSPVTGAVVGFKSSSKTTPGLAVSAVADADIYVTTDGAGNYSMPVLKDSTYYVAAWKDGYTPSEDVGFIANVSQAVDLSITSEAGVNLALGKTTQAGKLYASPTGLGTNPVNNAFDGNAATYFSWNTSSQKDLVIDVTKSDGTADSINGITLITDSYRVYNWELWVENNAAPISGGTRNTSANWTKVYQSTGSYGGYDRTGVNGQVIDPVRLAATSARGVWIKIITGSSSETRPLEVMVHSSAGPVSIASIKTLPDGTSVVLSGKSVVWAPRDGEGVRLTDYFYIEDLGGASGIGVQNPVGSTDTVKVNDMVSIAGTMATGATTGERYINATIIPAGSAGSGVDPYETTTQVVQTDTSVVGKLVSVTGLVRQVAADGSWFTITDGYMSGGSEVQTKVYVQGIQLPAYLASINDTIKVVGAVAREYSSGSVKSVIMLFNYDKITDPNANEVTFFTVSDIHYGKSGTVTDADRATIDMMNALPGNPYPAALGGYVQTPWAVVEIGDIAEGGTAAQFDQFAFDYGINSECRLRYPVFEGLGNHDGRVTNPVGLRVKARNTLRRGLTAISSNGMHYSWDWNGIHFVHCNVAPTDVNEGNLAGDLNYALQFLKEDLPAHVGSSGRPVIIFHHWGFESFSATWWTDNERANYYNVIKDYNVIAIAHGHTHTAGTYQWNGIDVYQDGAGQADPDPGGFFVFRVKPTQLSVAQRVFNTTTQQWQWGLNWTKSFTNPNP